MIIMTDHYRDINAPDQFIFDHADDLFSRLEPRHDYWTSSQTYIRFQRTYAGNKREILQLNFSWWDYDSEHYYLVRLFDPMTKQTIRYHRLRRSAYTGRALMVRVDEPKGGFSDGQKEGQGD